MLRRRLPALLAAPLLLAAACGSVTHPSGAAPTASPGASAAGRSPANRKARRAAAGTGQAAASIIPGTVRRFIHTDAGIYPPGYDLYVIHGAHRLRRAPRTGGLDFLYDLLRNVPDEAAAQALATEANTGGWNGIYIDVCDWRTPQCPRIVAAVKAHTTLPVITNGWPFHSSAQYRDDPSSVAAALRLVDGFQLEAARPGDAWVLDGNRDRIVLVKVQDPEAVGEVVAALRSHVGARGYFGVKLKAQ